MDLSSPVGLPSSTDHPEGMSTETMGGRVFLLSNSILDSEERDSRAWAKGGRGGPLKEKPARKTTMTTIALISLLICLLSSSLLVPTKDRVQDHLRPLQRIIELILCRELDFHRLQLSLETLE